MTIAQILMVITLLLMISGKTPLYMTAIIGSAMTTIVVTNETRLLTITLNQLQDERDKFDIEWRHLLLEQNALAEHSRVSDIAKSKLQMARPSPLKEKIINQP